MQSFAGRGNELAGRLSIGMVTQTAPAGSKPNVGNQGAEFRRDQLDTRAADSDVVLERGHPAPQEAPGEVGVPSLVKGSWARIVTPLMSAYDWLSGVPLTQQERRVRELEESNRIRKAVLLLFVY